jgi:ubiquinone/menaquinone biosynthesis C-methylase UbiE
MSDQGQWQVTDIAAEIYERALVPAVFAAWAPLVVALADPQPGERILDVACGTGWSPESLRGALGRPAVWSGST